MAFRDEMSDAQWERRVDLAACYRLVDLYDMSDGIGTHISARVPDKPDVFLVNPYGWLFDEITASSLVEVDVEGQALTATERTVNPAGFVIHSCIHRARPDIACVLHTHTVPGMAVSAQRRGLLPLTQHAMQFYNRIGYHEYEGLVTDPGEQQRLVAALGEHKALVLRNHGLITAGASVAEAFYLMWRLNKACKAQLQAMTTGEELVFPDEEASRKTSDVYWGSSEMISELAWPAFRRQLDRLGIDFAC